MKKLLILALLVTVQAQAATITAEVKSIAPYAVYGTRNMPIQLSCNHSVKVKNNSGTDQDLFVRYKLCTDNKGCVEQTATNRVGADWSQQRWVTMMATYINARRGTLTCITEVYWGGKAIAGNNSQAPIIIQ